MPRSMIRQLYACLRSGWYILGRELEEFEERFATYLGVRFCIGVNSGMDALILAVRALEIGPGDEVIVPANTYIASVLGITENGATPVFVEPDEYMNLDPQRIGERYFRTNKGDITGTSLWTGLPDGYNL